MGKQKRARTKYHTLPKKDDIPEKMEISNDANDMVSALGAKQFNNTNPFENLKINMDSINPFKIDDTKSMKSFKSYKSNKSSSNNKPMTKKEKFKLRKDYLLKRIDTIKQIKEEAQNKKKKHTPLPSNNFADTDNLFPALKSLKSNNFIPTIDQSKCINIPKSSTCKGKAIYKANKRQANILNNIQQFKQLLKESKSKNI